MAFALTPGNVADISMAIPLLAAVARPNRLIADKAYDADSLRNWLKIRRVKAVIPSTALILAIERVGYDSCVKPGAADANSRYTVLALAVAATSPGYAAGSDGTAPA